MEPAKSRLSRGYSRAAPYYDSVAGPLYEAGLRRLLPSILLPPGPAILDIGCGTGVNLIEAARWFSPARLLAGIDLSPGMIQVARAKAAFLGLPAQFVVGDAEQLPYPDQSFDLVICNSVLHWFKEKATALNEMRRVLRPGGQIIIISAAYPAFREWFSLLDGLMRSALGETTPSSMPGLLTADEVVRLMQTVGLTVTYLNNPVLPQPVQDPDSFVRLMSIVAPGWAADLSPETQAYLEQAAANALRRFGPGGFVNTWSVVEAIGVRSD